MNRLRFRTPEEVVTGLPNWIYLIVYLFFFLLGLGVGYWIWG